MSASTGQDWESLAIATPSPPCLCSRLSASPVSHSSSFLGIPDRVRQGKKQRGKRNKQRDKAEMGQELRTWVMKLDHKHGWREFSPKKKRGASSIRGKANRGAVGLKTTPTLSSQARGDGCGELLSITAYEGL